MSKVQKVKFILSICRNVGTFSPNKFISTMQWNIGFCKSLIFCVIIQSCFIAGLRKVITVTNDLTSAWLNVLLNSRAAFSTIVNVTTLLTSLERLVGIHSTGLSWYRLYLTVTDTFVFLLSSISAFLQHISVTSGVYFQSILLTVNMLFNGNVNSIFRALDHFQAVDIHFVEEVMINEDVY